MASKCLFCKREMNNKLEQHIKACHKCIVDLLMKKHNLKVKKQAPVSFSLKKYDKI
jgi:ribosomal protein L37AE/L43A